MEGTVVRISGSREKCLTGFRIVKRIGEQLVGLLEDLLERGYFFYKIGSHDGPVDEIPLEICLSF